MFGSVVVRKQEVKNPGRLKALERFELLYSADFNPNSSNLISFRKDVEKEHLGTYLVSLCKYFYERENEEDLTAPEVLSPPAAIGEEAPARFVYQCRHCQTIYDATMGDEANGIPTATGFHNLPATYQCPLCESGKADFHAVEANQLYAVTS
jgi:rubredoxin